MLRWFSHAAAVVVVLAGLAALLGWTFDLEDLKRLFLGRVAMNPVTALAFVLGGASLWLSAKGRPGLWAHHSALAAALAVAMVGLLRLGAYLLGRDLGIDTWLFATRLGDGVDLIPNRMAPNTALAFSFLGLGLMLRDRITAHGRRTAEFFLLTVGLIALLAVIGYAYGVDQFYIVSSFIPMALPTALSFILLSLGGLCARLDRGLMAVVTSDCAGGGMLRRLLPVAVVLPALLGGLRLAGQRAGFYGTEFGLALMVVVHIVLFAALIVWYARFLHAADAVRARSENDLRRAHDELEARVRERTEELNLLNDSLVAEVAERRGAEATLLREREFLQALLYNLNDGIVACDAEGVLNLFNRAAEGFLGHSVEPISAERWTGRYGVRRADGSTPMPKEESPLYRAWRGETVRDVNLVVSGEGRLTQNHLVSGQPFFDSQGTKLGAVVVMHDVTAQRLAEEARGRAEASYRSIFENATEGIFQSVPGGGFIRVNPALARLYGYGSPAELVAAVTNIGRDLYVEDGRRDDFARLMEEHGAVSGFESAIRRRDGSIIWISENAHALRNDRGAVVLYEGSVEDVTARKRAEQEIRDLNTQLDRRLSALTALRRIDVAITSSDGLEETLDTVLDQTMVQLGVHAAAVLLLDPLTQTLAYAASHSFRGAGIVESRVQVGEGASGRAVLERRRVHIPDLTEAREDFTRSRLLAGESFTAYFAQPLVVKGQVIGVLEVFHREALAPDAEWLDFLETLASRAAIALEDASLVEKLLRSNLELTFAYDATIEGWSRALDLRDKETDGHSRRVTEMTLRLARAMGMSEDKLVHVRRGALLHDIGKMGVPDGILLKPGPLTDQEWKVMRRHPGYAHEWLSPIPYLLPALDVPYCHHEKWDGSGYPRGLVGEQIPLAARVFAVVDVWDALRSDRPYRKGWPDERIRAQIRGLSGTHFDPAVVEAFLRLVSADAQTPVAEEVGAAAV